MKMNKPLLFLIIIAVFGGVYVLTRLFTGNMLDVTPASFSSATTHTVDTHVIDQGGVAVNAPALVRSTNRDAEVVWINREDTKRISLTADGALAWNTLTTLVTGMQTATDWRGFGYIAPSAVRAYLGQATQKGVFVMAEQDSWTPVEIEGVDCPYNGCGNVALARDGENNILYGFYTQTHHQGQQGVYMFSSDDNGETWSSTRLLDDIAYASPTARPIARTSGGELILLYDDVIYTSADRGVSWSKELTLTSEFGPSHAQLEVDTEGNIYVAWQAKEITEQDIDTFSGGYVRGNEYILFAQQNNGVWTDPVAINDTPLTFDITIPDLDVPMTEYFREQSNLPNAVELFDIAVSNDGSQASVLWKDSRNGASELQFSATYTQGKAWTANQRIKNNGKVALEGALAIGSDNTTYATWVRYTPSPDDDTAIPQPTELVGATIIPNAHTR